MCGVSGTTMTTVAETLQRDGLVERIRNPADRRSYALTRTAAGRAAAGRWAPTYTARGAPDLRAHPARRHPAAAAARSAWSATSSTRSTPAGPARQHRLPAQPRAHQRIHREFLTALGPLDIDPRHVGTMRALRAAGPVDPGAARRLLDVSPATVVQIVDHLEARGLVARERDPDDRRAYRLHLRPPAAAVVAEAASIARADRTTRASAGPRAGHRDDLTRLLRKFLASPVAR